MAIETSRGIRYIDENDGDKAAAVNQALDDVNRELDNAGAVQSVNDTTGAVVVDDTNLYALDPTDAITKTLRDVLANIWAPVSTIFWNATSFGISLLNLGNAFDLREAAELGDSATRNIGTTAGTVAAGNDTRLSDSRAPTAHTHSSLVNAAGTLSVDASGNTNVSKAMFVGVTNKATIFPDYTGNNELPAGALIGSVTTGDFSFFPSIFGTTIGRKIVLGYWNGAGRSAVEVANVASGDGTLLVMKSGGKVGIGTSAPHSTLHGAGSRALGADTAFGAATTLTIAHYALYFDTSAGNINQTLPSATGLDGREYLFFKSTADANTLTISPTTGQGAATVLSAQDSSVTYRAFNSKWRKIAQI